jgi:ABC-2 type transport system permease protein
MAINKIALQSVNVRAWQMGFANLFRKEHAGWWHTRTWLIHSIVWLLLVNGILLAVLKTPVPPEAAAVTPPDSGTMIFVIMGGLMTGLGIIIVMQGAVIDEKKSGTAAWVLSKPLSRTAFILAKLAANSLAALLIMVVLQGVVAFGLLSTFDNNPPALLPFVAALGLMALHLLFYLTLTLMLGTLFNERGAVLGIPIGLLFGAQFLMQLAPALASIMPWTLVVPSAGGSLALAHLVMLGQPLPTVTPIIATMLWIVIFVGVALWRFGQEEF